MDVQCLWNQGQGTAAGLKGDILHTCLYSNHYLGRGGLAWHAFDLCQRIFGFLKEKSTFKHIETMFKRIGPLAKYVASCPDVSKSCNEVLDSNKQN